MRVAITGFGVLAIVIGAVWMGQGTGVFPYPASSFMINDMAWFYWGLALAVLGAIAIVFGRPQ